MAKLDLRSDETLEKYLTHKAQGNLRHGCRLCDEDSIAEFEHWRIIKNLFPYDRIASVHHMLVSKVHALERDLHADSWTEFMQLKTSYLNDHYDLIIEAMPSSRSIPSHHHYHLIVQKEV